MDRRTKLKYRMMHALHLFLPLHRKSVVFCSFSGGSYSDNPKAVSEQLHRMDPSVRQVWLFNDPSKKKAVVPSYACVAKRWGFRSIYELATAKCWIFNDTLPYWACKGKNQIYIQTWHGDRGFKKILNDCKPRSEGNELPETRLCDLAVAGSDFGASIFRSAFRYPGRILKTGTPRNDRLLNSDRASAGLAKSGLGLENSVKCVLYAPTLRRAASKTSSKQEIQHFDMLDTLDMLEKETKSQWSMLVRAHSKVSGLSGIPKSEKIVDVSHFEDMVDLLEAADLLITDYSSSVGDFALTGRPIILYQDDRDQYLQHERTFYFDLDTSPFWIARNQQELVSILKDLPNRDSKKNCEEILSFYKTCETGHASKDVCDFILEQMR
jgi:CDP-glycerol glycerophosphotransferase